MVADAGKPEREVVMKFVAELIPYSNNSRTHSDEQVATLAGLIKEYGWTNPVLIDDKNGIIAGHGRLLAARKLGIDKVPCIVLTGLTDAQRRAYIIADNRSALDSDWDEDVLAVEFQRLQGEGFDLSMTGFAQEEIDKFLQAMPGAASGSEPEEQNTVDFYVVTVTSGKREDMAQLQAELTERGFSVKMEETKGKVKE